MLSILKKIKKKKIQNFILFTVDPISINQIRMQLDFLKSAYNLECC